jgi:hypothetical protein
MDAIQGQNENQSATFAIIKAENESLNEENAKLQEVETQCNVDEKKAKELALVIGMIEEENKDLRKEVVGLKQQIKQIEANEHAASAQECLPRIRLKYRPRESPRPILRLKMLFKAEPDANELEGRSQDILRGAGEEGRENSGYGT